MDTNVKGVFFLTQRLLPLLEAGATADDPSRVINIGSIDGIRTPSFDTVSYGPSKAAVHALTSQLAAKLVKRNILVNAIAPGPVPDVDAEHRRRHRRRRRRHRLGRARPHDATGSRRHAEDIAGLAIFLASRAGAFTVGEVITCDGGHRRLLKPTVIGDRSADDMLCRGPTRGRKQWAVDLLVRRAAELAGSRVAR